MNSIKSCVVSMLLLIEDKYFLLCSSTLLLSQSDVTVSCFPPTPWTSAASVRATAAAAAESPGTSAAGPRLWVRLRVQSSLRRLLQEASMATCFMFVFLFY